MRVGRERLPVLLAACGSAALLLAALGFQHLGGLPPCKLCIWQRWPHLVAAAIGAAAPFLPIAALRVATLPGALAAAATASVAAYHSGVERGWWEGPSTCTGSSTEGLTPEELLQQILEAPVTRCDEVLWQFLGLSMADWNFAASVALAAIWIAGYRALGKAVRSESPAPR